MTFTFSIVEPIFFLQSVVSTSFFDDRLHTEFTIHMNTRSREWRRGTMPTTDCDAQCTLDFKAPSRKLKEYSLKTSVAFFGTQMMDKICTKHRHEQSRVPKRSDADNRLGRALTTLCHNSSAENTKNIPATQTMMILSLQICV